MLISKLARQERMRDYLHRALKEDGELFQYLRREKLQSAQRHRTVARQMDGFQQNNKSDWRLLAAVPAREFFRWKEQDPHFWDDNKNLKSYRRDNPDARIYV